MNCAEKPRGEVDEPEGRGGQTRGERWTNSRGEVDEPGRRGGRSLAERWTNLRGEMDKPGGRGGRTRTHITLMASSEGFRRWTVASLGAPWVLLHWGSFSQRAG